MPENDLILTYRKIDKAAAELSGEMYGQKDPDTGAYLCTAPTETLTRTLKEKCISLREEVSSLPAPSLKFETLKSHFEDFLDNTLRELDGLLSDPAGPFASIIWGYPDIIRKCRKTDDEKARRLMATFAQLPGLWDGIQGWCFTCTDDRKRAASALFKDTADEIREYLSDFDALMPQASPENRTALRTSMEKAEADFTAFAAALTDSLSDTENAPAKAVIPDQEKAVRMEKDKYAGILRYQYGVDLEEILSWGDSEVNKTRETCFSIAAGLARQYGEPEPKTMTAVNDLLNKYAGPCDTPEEMISRANIYLRRTRALAHEVVDLPEDEDCICVPIPYRIRTSYPWGGYEGGDGESRPNIRGQMFLNIYNYKNVSDGWIRINALHEAYPGHHVQYVKSLTEPMPETIRIGAKSVALMEGMCLRTEKAFQYIYGEAPFYPLFVAYRRHHTSVRIKVDLMLFVEGKTIAEAVQTYMDELGFDETSARGQVLSQEYSPGYFTCYYYGMKKIEDWQQAYGFNKQDYTKLLFSAGNISLENFHRILQMDEQERYSFFHDFGRLPEEDKQSE